MKHATATRWANARIRVLAKLRKGDVQAKDLTSVERGVLPRMIEQGIVSYSNGWWRMLNDPRYPKAGATT